MKMILPLVFGLLFTGCVSNLVAVRTIPYKAEEVYEGYPCRDECPDFQKGYDQAQTDQVIQSSQCRGASDAETLGCKAYVNDFTYDSNPDPELTP